MIIDTHTHVVSSDKAKHPLDPGAQGWSTEVSNDVEDLIAEMDNAGVECATLVQPNGTYGLDNSYQCDSAQQFAPRTVAVGILDPAAADAADQLSYWVNERGMTGVRLQSQAEPDDPRCDALWQRAVSLGIPISIGGGGQPEKVDAMRNVGARHPNVLFAPDHFAGWSGAADKAAMTNALEELARLPNAYLRISSTSLGPYADLTAPEQELFRRVMRPSRHGVSCGAPTSPPPVTAVTSGRCSSGRRPCPGSPTTTSTGSWARPPTSCGRCCRRHPAGRITSGLPPASRYNPETAGTGGATRPPTTTLSPAIYRGGWPCRPGVAELRRPAKSPALARGALASICRLHLELR